MRRGRCARSSRSSRAPTPAGFANLIDLNTRGRNFDEAARLVSEALEKWPDHPALLHAASTLAQQRGDVPARLRYMERLLRLEPDNVRVRQAYEKAKETSRSRP